VLTACNEVSTNTDEVIAKIGTERVTEKQFHELVNALFDDPNRSVEFLTEEHTRGQRNEFLSKYLESKGLIMLAAEQGLDKDPRVQIQLNDAITQVYAQAIMERRMSSAEPTDDQLREIYNELRTMHPDIPPFAVARQHLPQLWMQKQQQNLAEALIKEIKEKYPITIADEYKSADS
jgi:hypothetical protein